MGRAAGELPIIGAKEISVARLVKSDERTLETRAKVKKALLQGQSAVDSRAKSAPHMAAKDFPLHSSQLQLFK